MNILAITIRRSSKKSLWIIIELSCFGGPFFASLFLLFSSDFCHIAHDLVYFVKFFKTNLWNWWNLIRTSIFVSGCTCCQSVAGGVGPYKPQGCQQTDHGSGCYFVVPHWVLHALWAERPQQVICQDQLDMTLLKVISQLATHQVAVGGGSLLTAFPPSDPFTCICAYNNCVG